jgi:uncharacterized Ntn-hydrolase superfamily protein
MLTSTFTILARCDATGEIGVAMSTAIPAGGAICPFVTQHGAISTQSFNNYYFGIDGQQLLAEGLRADEVGEALLRRDPGRELRQLLIVDGSGVGWAFTGRGCIAACGHRIGSGCVVGGNMLSNETSLDAMVDSFQSSRVASLTDRLMGALEAGQRNGGDRRGKQSAALRVSRPRGMIPVCDLRVDEHTDPVTELRRVLEIAKIQLFPFLRSMPTRTHPDGALTEALSAYLARTVVER